MITARRAGNLVRAFLHEKGLSHVVRAKTTYFTGIRPGVFVTVHGLEAGPIWAELHSLAKENDFFVKSDQNVQVG
jgi:hypothetical protein